MQQLLFAPFKKNTPRAQNLSFEDALDKELAVARVRYFRTENLSQEIKEGRD